MAKLKAATRNKLKPGSFALPKKRKYPIEDASHARNALSRAAHNASPAEQATIKRAVKRRFPGIKVEAHDQAKHQPHTGAIGSH
jgi:hypothetical protein